jgi:plastocyanin
LRRITWILVLGLAVLALGAAGCGGDDDEGGDGTGSSATETPAATETPTEAPTEAPTESAGGETLTVTADPGGGISWDPTTLSAAAGSVTLKLVSESSTPHAIEIEGNGAEGKTDTITGGEAEVTVDLQAGEYTYFCPVGNHAETMTGTLTVE